MGSQYLGRRYEEYSDEQMRVLQRCATVSDEQIRNEGRCTNTLNRETNILSHQANFAGREGARDFEREIKIFKRLQFRGYRKSQPKYRFRVFLLWTAVSLSYEWRILGGFCMGFSLKFTLLKTSIVYHPRNRIFPIWLRVHFYNLSANSRMRFYY